MAQPLLCQSEEENRDTTQGEETLAKGPGHKENPQNVKNATLCGIIFGHVVPEAPPKMFFSSLRCSSTWVHVHLRGFSWVFMKQLMMSVHERPHEQRIFFYFAGTTTHTTRTRQLLVKAVEPRISPRVDIPCSQPCARLPCLALQGVLRITTWYNSSIVLSVFFCPLPTPASEAAASTVTPKQYPLQHKAHHQRGGGNTITSGRHRFRRRRHFPTLPWHRQKAQTPRLEN